PGRSGAQGRRALGGTVAGRRRGHDARLRRVREARLRERPPRPEPRVPPRRAVRGERRDRGFPRRAPRGPRGVRLRGFTLRGRCARPRGALAPRARESLLKAVRAARILVCTATLAFAAHAAAEDTPLPDS